MLSLGLRSIISHEDEDLPYDGKTIYAELFLSIGEIVGAYLFGWYYHKRGNFIIFV